jgi:hypothetical protein
MSKRKAKEAPAKEDVRRLRFNGENGSPFIPGIPARDLEHQDLIELSLSRGCAIDALVTLLCSDTPGRRIRAGKPLYSVNKPHICPQCEEEFVLWDKFHKHALTHVNENESQEKQS